VLEPAPDCQQRRDARTGGTASSRRSGRHRRQDAFERGCRRVVGDDEYPIVDRDRVSQDRGVRVEADEDEGRRRLEAPLEPARPITDEHPAEAAAGRLGVEDGHARVDLDPRVRTDPADPTVPRAGGHDCRVGTVQVASGRCDHPPVELAAHATERPPGPDPGGVIEAAVVRCE
jgi:hypothetical protein